MLSIDVFRASDIALAVYLALLCFKVLWILAKVPVPIFTASY
jgi:hypothetical protein